METIVCTISLAKNTKEEAIEIQKTVGRW